MWQYEAERAEGRNYTHSKTTLVCHDSGRVWRNLDALVLVLVVCILGYSTFWRKVILELELELQWSCLMLQVEITSFGEGMCLVFSSSHSLVVC